MSYELGLRPLVRPVEIDLKIYVNLSVLPTPPASKDWGLGVTSDWMMFGNDTVGDCFFAAAAHAFMAWSANAQAKMDEFSDAQVLKAYGLCTGYNPADPSTDHGTEPGQGYNFLRSTGIAGHKFGPLARVNPRNHDLVRAAQWLFGGIMVGTEVPKDWEMEQVWDVSNSSILGGHAIYNSAYDTDPKMMGTVVTWGSTRRFTWDANDRYVTQLVASVPSEWISDLNLAPSGFDLEALLADEKALAA